MQATKRRRSTLEMITAAARQEKAIAALLATPTVAAAAAASGIGESTLRRMLTRPKFTKAYAVARKQIMNQVVGSAVIGITDAIATLRRNLTCGNPSAEVAAARALADIAFRGEQHLFDLGDRKQIMDAIAVMQERLQKPPQT